MGTLFSQPRSSALTPVQTNRDYQRIYPITSQYLGSFIPKVSSVLPWLSTPALYSVSLVGLRAPQAFDPPATVPALYPASSSPPAPRSRGLPVPFPPNVSSAHNWHSHCSYQCNAIALQSLESSQTLALSNPVSSTLIGCHCARRKCRQLSCIIAKSPARLTFSFLRLL